MVQQQHRILSHFPNVAYNVVGIAASTGGLKAISKVLSTLPSNFPAAITIVQHVSSQFPSHLAQLLSDRTALRVKQATMGDLLCPGTVYVAIPGRHLLVNSDGTLSFSDSAKVNFARPSADMLFTSMAKSYRSRAVAVVLTGRASDGLLGVLAVKKHGGTVIAQDEATSECFSMPKAVISSGKVDFVLPLEAIASTLVSTVMAPEIGAAG